MRKCWKQEPLRQLRIARLARKCYEAALSRANSLSVICTEESGGVGCGSGAWLAEPAEPGVSEIRGVDGDYVNRDNYFLIMQISQRSI
jgi:hypothetical protein